LQAPAASSIVFERFLDGLPEDERDAAEAMLADPEWPTAKLYRLLRNRGMAGSAPYFDHWRRDRRS